MSGWTIIGDYVNMEHRQGTVPKFTCKIPCTIKEYDYNGFVTEYKLSTVGQTVQGLSGNDGHSWEVI